MYVSHHSFGKSDKRNFNKMDQKWASRARVVEKTRKFQILTKNGKVDFALQNTANLGPAETNFSFQDKITKVDVWDESGRKN